MHFKIIFMIMGFLCPLAPIIAQDMRQEKPKKLTFSGFSVFVIVPNGLGVEHDNRLALFNRYAPNSSILQKDFSGFENQATLTYADGDYKANLVAIRFDLPKKISNATRYLQFGLGFVNGSNLNGSLNRVVSTPYDTIYSSLTGNPVQYINSNIAEDLDIDNMYSNLIFDIALVKNIQTKFDRLSLYWGYGLNAQLSMWNETTVKYTKVGPYLGDSFFGTFYPLESETETFNNSRNYALGLYIPAGFNYKVSKRNRLLKYLHVFAEGRPGISYFGQPVIDQNKVRYNYNLAVGFKYF